MLLFLSQVNPSETWLSNSVTEQAFFPQHDGSFNLVDVTAYTTLSVEGPVQSSSLPPPLRSQNLPRSSITLSSTPSTSNLPPSPSFRSVIAPRRTSSFSLKVVKAKLAKTGKCKPEFEPISQTYIELVDSTANLEHILGVIHQRWGSQFTLVTNDGIELEESPATQGYFVVIFTLYIHYSLSYLFRSKLLEIS